VTWSYERPIARSGNRDQRAWDAAIEVGGKRFGIEAETRLGDIQALQRRIALKLRDDPATAHAILLLADTRRNRTVVRANLEALRSGFPVEAAAAVEALSSGLDPGGSSVVLV
jgi:hypothetical protein